MSTDLRKASEVSERIHLKHKKMIEDIILRVNKAFGDENSKFSNGFECAQNTYYVVANTLRSAGYTTILSSVCGNCKRSHANNDNDDSDDEEIYCSCSSPSEHIFVMVRRYKDEDPVFKCLVCLEDIPNSEWRSKCKHCVDSHVHKACREKCDKMYDCLVCKKQSIDFNA